MAMSRSLGSTSLTTRSPMVSVPSEMSSRPAIMRSVVDLPQPDGPTNTMNSLSFISRLKSWTATTFLSYTFLTCSSFKLAIFAILPYPFTAPPVTPST